MALAVHISSHARSSRSLLGVAAAFGFKEVEGEGTAAKVQGAGKVLLAVAAAIEYTSMDGGALDVRTSLTRAEAGGGRWFQRDVPSLTRFRSGPLDKGPVDGNGAALEDVLPWQELRLLRPCELLAPWISGLRH